MVSRQIFVFALVGVLAFQAAAIAAGEADDDWDDWGDSGSAANTPAPAPPPAVPKPAPAPSDKNDDNWDDAASGEETQTQATEAFDESKYPNAPRTPEEDNEELFSVEIDVSGDGEVVPLVVHKRDHFETVVSAFCARHHRLGRYHELLKSLWPMYNQKAKPLNPTIDELREAQDPTFYNPRIQYRFYTDKNLEVRYKRSDNFSEVAQRFVEEHRLAPEWFKWVESMLEVRNRTTKYDEGFMGWMQETYRMYEGIPARITSPSAKRVFLDIGSRTGEFYRQLSPFWFFEGFQWYLYECNPRTAPYIHSMVSTRQNVTYFEKAVWTSDGTMSFWIDNDPEQADHGSSLFSDHAMVEGEELMATVETVDFSKWLQSLNLTKDDMVVMRMDIEGAEYEVLRKMIVDGTAALIDHLDLECHAGFAPSLRKHLPADKTLPWIFEGYGTTVTVGNYYQEIQCEPGSDGKEVCINTSFN